MGKRKNKEDDDEDESSEETNFKTRSSKKGKDDSGSARRIVKEYLEKQNRPYNDKMVFENLHGVVGKTQVGKILGELVESDDAVEKEFGKFKIYWPNQAKMSNVSKEEIAQLDEDLNQAKENLKETSDKLKDLESEKHILSSSYSDQQLKEEVAKSTALIQKNSSKLDNLRQNADKVDRKEFETYKNRLINMMKAWKQRSRLCKDIVGVLQESGSSLIAIKEETGIEFDEDVNVSLKGIHEKFENIGGNVKK